LIDDVCSETKGRRGLSSPAVFGPALCLYVVSRPLILSSWQPLVFT